MADYTKLEESKGVWEEYILRCPECKSKRIEPQNLFQGMYKKGNPYKLKNKQQYKCMKCGFDWWIEI